MKRFSVILFLITILSFQVFSNDIRERYLNGVENYGKGEYLIAAEIWTDLYNAGYDNFELLYNLGNALYKLEEIPMAILFYHRALLRRPWDDDTKYNLSVAENLTRDRYTAIPQIFLVRWFNFSALALSSYRWAIMAVTCFVMSLLLILLFLFTSNYGLKRTTFWLSLMLIILSATSVMLSLRNDSLVYNSKEAIILSPVVTGRSAPSDSSQELFVIHEGLKVRTGEQIGEWCELRLPDGNRGWVPVLSIERF